MRKWAYKTAAIYLLLAVTSVFGCPDEQNTSTQSQQDVKVPHGYAARLEQIHEGRLLGFGPFKGYYFRPENPQDLRRLSFICFNEDNFYSSDMPAGARLFEGTAVRTTLSRVDFTIPSASRINPVFFEDAPEVWLDSRPAPREKYRHFHSCYDATGPVLTGYWLHHMSVAEFTYDMGGRVTENSRLYHFVSEGSDKNFAEIIEFDRGPLKSGSSGGSAKD